MTPSPQPVILTSSPPGLNASHDSPAVQDWSFSWFPLSPGSIIVMTSAVQVTDHTVIMLITLWWHWSHCDSSDHTDYSDYTVMTVTSVTTVITTGLLWFSLMSPAVTPQSSSPLFIIIVSPCDSLAWILLYCIQYSTVHGWPCTVLTTVLASI